MTKDNFSICSLHNYTAYVLRTRYAIYLCIKMLEIKERFCASDFYALYIPLVTRVSISQWFLFLISCVIYIDFVV